MNTPRVMTFFKAGAWIMALSGFAHAAVAILDTFLRGAFSPAADSAVQALKDTTINIAEWLKGSDTSILASAWGAYVGFAIAVGLLTGCIGLILLLALKGDNKLDNRNRALLGAALGTSAAMTVISILFYFWFPTVILVAGLACFIIAWFKQAAGERSAAR
jgi:hypothetical protein